MKPQPFNYMRTNSNNVNKRDNYITQTHKLHEAIDQFTVCWARAATNEKDEEHTIKWFY